MRALTLLPLFCAAAWCAGQTTYASAGGRMLTLEELMDTTISVSTGTQKRVTEAPSIATVITAEQIERLSATTLAEVLESVPGLFAYLAPSNYYSGVDIRGIHTTYGPQIVLMVNGTTIKNVRNNYITPRFNFPASLIQRIEIIRGPGSAVYGADAFSGVINVITKDAQSLAGVYEAGVRLGSFNAKETFVRGGTSIGEAKVSLNLSYMTEGNEKDRIFAKDQQSVFDKAFGTHASLAPGSLETRGEWLNLTLNGTYKDFEMNFWGQISRDLGTGAGNSFAIDPRGHYEGEQAQLDVYHRSHPADGLQWEQKLSLSYTNITSRLYLFPSGALLPIGKDGNAFSAGGKPVLFPDGYIGSPGATDYGTGIESTLLVSKYENHLLRVSVGGKYDKAEFSAEKNFGPSVIDGSISPIYGTLTDVSRTPYIYIPNHGRRVFFASLQDEIALAPAWTLTAGIRDDHYSDFGNTINPRLALVWHEHPSLSVKMLYGKAFRAPSFQEFYIQNNPVGIGNSNLRPETMDMRELGVDYQPSTGWHIGVNIYDYVADKLISTIPIAVGTQFVNTGKLFGRGIETILQYQPIESVLLSADHAYRWTKNEATGKGVVDAPVHIGHVRADWEFYTHTILAWETQFVGNIPRAQNDTRQKIGGYTVSNLSIGYDPTKQWNTKFAVRNLFDKTYYYPTPNVTLSDLPAPGRSAALQLTYRF